MANKTCPFCQSTIALEAVVCRYCQREIDTAEGVKARILKKNDKRSIIVVSIAVIAGFAIFSQPSKDSANSISKSSSASPEPSAQVLVQSPAASSSPRPAQPKRRLILRSWPEDPKFIRVPNPNDLTYEEISRSPGAYGDSILVLKGRIVQAVEDDAGGGVLRVNVTPSKNFRHFDDTVYVEYQGRPSRRLLEGDVVQVIGDFAGIKSYRTVLGATVQVPFVRSSAAPEIDMQTTQWLKDR